MISVRFLSSFCFLFFFISETSGFCRQVLVTAAANDTNGSDEGNFNFSFRLPTRCEVPLALCRLNEATATTMNSCD